MTKDWRFWLVVAIVAAVVIVAVVCHLIQPQVSYAWLEVVAAFTFVLGALVGGITEKILKNGKE